MSFRKITVKSGNEESTMNVTEEEYRNYYRPWWLSENSDNTKDNYNELKENANFRIKVNRYALRKPYNTYIEAPIYICSNGNVVSSSMLSYNYEDDKDNVICNILKDDLFKSMDNWNFKNPLLKHQRDYKEKCLSEIFNYKRGIKRIYRNQYHENYILTDELIRADEDILSLLDFVETVKKNLHEKLPYLTYDELQFCGDTLLELKTEGQYLKSFLSDYEQSENYSYNEKELLDGFNAYVELNSARKPQKNLLFELLKGIFKER